MTTTTATTNIDIKKMVSSVQDHFSWDELDIAEDSELPEWKPLTALVDDLAPNHPIILDPMHAKALLTIEVPDDVVGNCPAYEFLSQIFDLETGGLRWPGETSRDFCVLNRFHPDKVAALRPAALTALPELTHQIAAQTLLLWLLDQGFKPTLTGECRQDLYIRFELPSGIAVRYDPTPGYGAIPAWVSTDDAFLHRVARRVADNLDQLESFRWNDRDDQELATMCLSLALHYFGCRYNRLHRTFFDIPDAPITSRSLVFCTPTPDVDPLITSVIGRIEERPLCVFDYEHTFGPVEQD